MSSLPVNVNTHISRIFLAILVAALLGCSNHKNSAVDISPKNFKVQVPFMLDGRGIVINTYWGSAKTHHVLCLDNYSPSWIKSSLIKYNKSFIKSTELSFRTSTADGSPIQGDVGICDSLTFENITFNKVPFYVMDNIAEDNKNDDGVFGGDLMSKGIWKIDFKKNELTFVSDADSLTEINQSEVFPAVFDDQSIKVDVRFGNNITKTMAIDLGFNGSILLPAGEFNKMSAQKKTFTELVRFITPASEDIVNNLMFFDTVNINHNWFFAIVSSNKTVKEQLIGLGFFMRFNYVIFDFINEKIYIPKQFGKQHLATFFGLANKH